MRMTFLWDRTTRGLSTFVTGANVGAWTDLMLAGLNANEARGVGADLLEHSNRLASK